MNIKYSSTLLGAALGLALLSAPAHGAVIVESSTIGDNAGWQPSSITAGSFGTFSLSGSDKLVVTLAGRDSPGFSNVTYNGQTLTQAVSALASGFSTSIWYLDNPGTTTGDLQFSGGVRGVIAGLYALSGTADGFGATGSDPTSSATLTTTSANSWVLASAGFHRGGESISLYTAPVPTAGSPMTEGENMAQAYARRSDEPSYLGDGYQTVATAGSATSAFDSGDVTVAAEFTAIPEPSTALLGGLALLALLRRRR